MTFGCRFGLTISHMVGGTFYEIFATGKFARQRSGGDWLAKSCLLQER
jgi:hypothetical protein